MDVTVGETTIELEIGNPMKVYEQAPLGTILAELPEQILPVGLTEKLMVGRGVTLTVPVAVPVQPPAAVPSTV